MLLSFALFMLGCSDPGKDKAAAVVTEAPKPVPAAPALAPAAGVKTLAATGTIGFVGAKVTGSHEGKFTETAASFDVEGDTVKAVKAEVKLATGVTDAAKLDEHLKSPDFWDVATHPVATFVSTEIRPGAGPDTKLPGATHTVVGTLTLRGATKQLEVPVALAVSPTAVSGKTEFSINRQDFGINYPGKADDLIADNVLIKVDLNATR